jgi:hypothetical protein
MFLDRNLNSLSLFDMAFFFHPEGKSSPEIPPFDENSAPS